MNYVKNTNHYNFNNDIDFAVVIIILGLILSYILNNSWIGFISIVACLFVKDDKDV
ncbi:hypothetical protein [Clostridium oceanicum]|uniref:Uncharacterized protein n=1 Tax=Clostridium oceanicum TaxID=1543 RepID=A0ABP3ULQ8_9CLOT